MFNKDVCIHKVSEDHQDPLQDIEWNVIIKEISWLAPEWENFYLYG